MERLFKKRLLQDLKKLTSCNLHGLDNNSFSQGYSNGFVKGFFYARNWIIGILIILAVSLIFNFISFI
jgi:hypothetical protein